MWWLLSILPATTLGLSILTPRDHSTHYLWGSELPVNRDLDIEVQANKEESMYLLSSTSPSTSPQTAVSICCQWTTGQQCVSTNVGALQSYYDEHYLLDLHLNLPWSRLVDLNVDHSRRGTSIQFHVVALNMATKQALQSSNQTITFHGQITSEDILAAPSFVINMKRKKQRWSTTSRRLRDAGYKKIVRWNAIDGSGSNESKDGSKEASENRTIDRSRTIEMMMAKKFGVLWGSNNHRACSSSHISLWMYLKRKWAATTTLNKAEMDHLPPLVSIFEDDALPHEEFHNLLPKYVSHVPSSAEIVYVGWQRGAIQSKGVVHVDPTTEPEMPYVLKRHPACLHAYIITRASLVKLLGLTLPLRDTIDGKLMRLAWKGQLESYAFNGMKHISVMLTTNLPKKNNQAAAQGGEGEEREEREEREEEKELAFDGETDGSTALLVVSGDTCPSGNCPRLVVSRMDRSRGIIFQDASMGTDIDTTSWSDDDAPPLSRYSKQRAKGK